MPQSKRIVFENMENVILHYSANLSVMPGILIIPVILIWILWYQKTVKFVQGNHLYPFSAGNPAITA